MFHFDFISNSKNFIVNSKIRFIVSINEKIPRDICIFKMKKNITIMLTSKLYFQLIHQNASHLAKTLTPISKIAKACFNQESLKFKVCNRLYNRTMQI